MKAARPLKPFHWVAIDLLALLMVVGWGLITYALAAGAWRPLGPVTPDYWTLLAFPVAIGVVSCFAVLLGWQLNAMGLLEADVSHRPVPRAVEESHTTEPPTREPATTAAPNFTPVNNGVEPLPRGIVEEETERVLIAAGR